MSVVDFNHILSSVIAQIGLYWKSLTFLLSLSIFIFFGPCTPSGEPSFSVPAAPEDRQTTLWGS